MIDPKDSKTIGFHLFLEPTGVLRDELLGLIKKLSREFGGPVFSPHVTLLARILAGNEEEVIAKSQKLADVMKSFSLTLSAPETRDAFFKALYLQIGEVGEMEKWHAKANEVFGMTDESPYTPHLSLLYGNYDVAKKEKVAKTISFPLGLSFVADKLHLYRTEGETEQWEKLEEFPFAL